MATIALDRASADAVPSANADGATQFMATLSEDQKTAFLLIISGQQPGPAAPSSSVREAVSAARPPVHPMAGRGNISAGPGASVATPQERPSKRARDDTEDPPAQKEPAKKVKVSVFIASFMLSNYGKQKSSNETSDKGKAKQVPMSTRQTRAKADVKGKGKARNGTD